MTDKQDTQHSTERLITFYQILKCVYYTKHRKQTNENDWQGEDNGIQTFFDKRLILAVYRVPKNQQG